MAEIRHSRRDWIVTSASLLPLGMLAPRLAPSGCTLSIGTYSLKGMTLEEAMPFVAKIGFDAIEIAVQPGFDGEPARLTPARRKTIRVLLADHRLRLTALMENLPPAAGKAAETAELDRLKHAFEIAHSLGDPRPPLLQTILGSGTWEARKALFLDRVGVWTTLAEKADVTIAIKPHRNGAMSKPSEAIWIINQLKNPKHLRMVYDYSHYAFRDLTLEDTIRESLPHTAHIAVKDAVRKAAGGPVTFTLPGEGGQIDYPKLLRLFHVGGYRGDVCCEVSSAVSGKPGYDPRSAASVCYRNMSRAFEQARVPRG